MPRRSLALLLAIVAVVAVVVVVLLARGGDSGTAVSDPLAEALGYAPASSQVVAALDVGPGSDQGAKLAELSRTSSLARFAGEEVRSSLRLLGLDPDQDQDIPSVVGGPLVIAGPASSARGLRNAVRGFDLDLTSVLRTGAIASIVGRTADDVDEVLDRAVADGRLKELPAGGAPDGTRLFALPENAGALGARDADLVLGADRTAVIRAMALRDRRGGLTRAVFEQRLGPLRGPALVRIALQPRALVGDRARGVPFVDALRGGAIALRLERPGIHLRAHLTTDPRRVRADQLPLAPGAAPPSSAPGLAPASAGVRDLSQTIDVLDAARGGLSVPFLSPVTSALDTIDSIKGPLRTFGRIDVDAAMLDQLTGTTTISREGRGIVIRAELRDGGPLRTALNRMAAIPDVLVDATNITTLDLDRSGNEAFLLKDSGRPRLRLAVLGNTLVASTDVSIGLRAVAARAPQRVSRPGALAFHADAGELQDQLIRRLNLPGLARLVLGEIGDLNGSIRSEVTGTDLDATLALNE